MSERNNWWIDDLDIDHINSLADGPAGLLMLDAGHDSPWVGLSDEHEFGGYAIFAASEIAPFLQRALRLREGRHPMTGDVLGGDMDPAEMLRQLLRGEGG